jgi:hypothetical protein
MKTTEALSAFILGLLACVTTSAGGSEKCSREAAISAETQAAAETWPELYQSFRRYAHCDDGAVAEVFSSSVALLLAEHWDAIDKLTDLAKAHPSFGRFVLRHIDVTMSLSQAETIRGNATDRCPEASKGTCERILKRMSEFKL